MAVRLYNTLSRSVEIFTPLDEESGSVGMYCCGPTVHDYAHIGNFRTFVFVDLLRRFLSFRGFKVRHVMNITDVEDKIIHRIRESGESLEAYTTRYRDAFLEDLGVLKCLTPDDMPHATAYIPEIIELIQKLETHGFAYRTQDGSVYFSISKYRESGRKYGQLLNLNFDAMRPGERVSNDEYDKDSIADFALWKAYHESDGVVAWESPWGKGRPGWHIECSAMSMKLLGTRFDIHTGGEDLIFPHHEDEIAQSEGACCHEPGKSFVKYWMHGAHLLVEGKKMSKSLGNFFTIKDLIQQGYLGREIRYLLLSSHYRESFNFTLDGLRGARSALNRIDQCVSKLVDLSDNTQAEPDSHILQAFTNALDEDLNVSKAWAVVFDWVRDSNRAVSSGAMSREKAAAAVATWHRLNEVLAIDSESEAAASQEVLRLAEERQEARKSRDFSRADEIRDALKELGWTVEDTPAGPKLKRLLPG